MPLKHGDIVEIHNLGKEAEGAIAIVVAATGRVAHLNWITPIRQWCFNHTEPVVCDVFIKHHYLTKLTEADL